MAKRKWDATTRIPTNLVTRETKIRRPFIRLALSLASAPAVAASSSTTSSSGPLGVLTLPMRPGLHEDVPLESFSKRLLMDTFFVFSCLVSLLFNSLCFTTSLDLCMNGVPSFFGCFRYDLPFMQLLSFLPPLSSAPNLEPFLTVFKSDSNECLLFRFFTF